MAQRVEDACQWEGGRARHSPPRRPRAAAEHPPIWPLGGSYAAILVSVGKVSPSSYGQGPPPEAAGLVVTLDEWETETIFGPPRGPPLGF